MPKDLANETFTTAVYFGHKWKNAHFSDEKHRILEPDQIEKWKFNQNLLKVIPRRLVNDLKQKGITLEMTEAKEIANSGSLQIIIAGRKFDEVFLNALQNEGNLYMDAGALSSFLKEHDIHVPSSDLATFHNRTGIHHSTRFERREIWATIAGSILQDALHPSDLQVSKEERKVIKAIASGKRQELSNLLQEYPYLEENARMTEETIRDLRSKNYMAGQTSTVTP